MCGEPRATLDQLRIHLRRESVTPGGPDLGPVQRFGSYGELGKHWQAER